MALFSTIRQALLHVVIEQKIIILIFDMVKCARGGFSVDNGLVINVIFIIPSTQTTFGKGSGGVYERALLKTNSFTSAHFIAFKQTHSQRFYASIS